MTDPISDFLTRVRNAIEGRKTQIELPYSRLKHRLADVLKDEGYLITVAEGGEDKKRTLVVGIRWDNQNRAAITTIRRVSKPGQRTYVGADAVPKVRGGLGVAIISTSKGLMSDRAARKARMGGEVLCEIW